MFLIISISSWIGSENSYCRQISEVSARRTRYMCSFYPRLFWKYARRRDHKFEARSIRYFRWFVTYILKAYIMFSYLILHIQLNITPNLLSEFLSHPELDENVAVIVFGEETKFLHYYSNQYTAIKQSIGVYMWQMFA